MQLKIENFSDNPQGFLRSCGYAFQKNDGDEMAFVRRLAGVDYPRFHIYSHTEQIRNGSTGHSTQRVSDSMSSPQVLVINLHLDQKKPSYEGTAMHGGEYSGELVVEEIERIKNLAGNITQKPKEKLNPW